MTIASEITRIKNNIANTYTALSDKGATMPATQNSANLANTVASIPAGGGDTVTAVNYTGSAITAGDKVWLNKKANVSASAVAVSTSSSNNVYIIEPTGNFVYHSTYKYDISTGTDIGGQANAGMNLGTYTHYYDEYNNIFIYNYMINASGSTQTTLYYKQGNYAAGNRESASRFHLYRIDKENNFAIVKDWKVYSENGNSYASSHICVIGDKMYYSETTTGYKLIATIDENATQINTSDRRDDYFVLHSTSDDKIAICTKPASSNVQNGWGEVKLINVNDDYTLGNVFVSANSELNNLLSQSPLYFSFNRITGILCISKYDSVDVTSYGVFKYENGDFTTISINLSNTLGQSWYGYLFMTASTDLSKIQFGNLLFTLEQTADGTYKAIPYSYAMGQQTLTGVADENAANGASFEATTIIPE